MMTSKPIFALAGFALMAAVAMPAQAEDDQCPQGWDMVRVTKAKDEVKARQIDKSGNQDDLVCEKGTPGNLLYSDNKKKVEPKPDPKPEQPKPDPKPR
jgi:hypothetical protein